MRALGWIGLGLAAGFAAGWFARPWVVARLAAAPPPLASPAPAAIVKPPAPPPFDGHAFVERDRAAAIAWWAGADASPRRDAVESALALPAGVGFFDYLPPIFDRTEPATPLGFFAGRVDDGRTCLYLAAKVPRAQGGLRLGRACDELTLTPPRWLAVRVGRRYALVDAKARRIETTDAPPPDDAPTFVFGLDADGRANARTSSATLVRAGDADARLARELVVDGDAGDFATSEVRPLDVTISPAPEADSRIATAELDRLYLHADGGAPDCRIASIERLGSPWIPFGIARARLACVGGPMVALVPLGGDAQAIAFVPPRATTFALPGTTGGFLTLATDGGALHLVSCDARSCAAQDASLAGE